jgi:hypothetical protein
MAVPVLAKASLSCLIEIGLFNVAIAGKVPQSLQPEQG